MNLPMGVAQIFSINVMSFGFKNGIPIDADLVFDVRFLKNPYYVEELRHKIRITRRGFFVCIGR